MKERDFKRFGNFIVREGGKELTHYYRVKTANPQIEWKFRSGTLMYSLLSEYSSNPTMENSEIIVTVLVAIYYVSTISDATMINNIYKYISKALEDVGELPDDISIDEAKGSYMAQQMLKGGAENEQS